MSDMETRYTTKDIADMLGVEAVTIRKYALALEKAGYDIDRSDGKNRSYSERDAMAFRYMQTIRSRTGITVEAAADVVAAKNKADIGHNGNIVSSGDQQLSNRYDDRYEQLAAQMLQITELFLHQQEQNDALKQELIEIRTEAAATKEQLTGVSQSLRDEIREGREETREQLSNVLSRIEKYGKRRGLLNRLFRRE